MMTTPNVPATSPSTQIQHPAILATFKEQTQRAIMKARESVVVANVDDAQFDDPLSPLSLTTKELIWLMECVACQESGRVFDAVKCGLDKVNDGRLLNKVIDSVTSRETWTVDPDGLGETWLKVGLMLIEKHLEEHRLLQFPLKPAALVLPKVFGSGVGKLLHFPKPRRRSRAS